MKKKEITPKSTKKELWDAYQELLQKIETDTKTAKQKSLSLPPELDKEYSEKQHLGKKGDWLDINQLKAVSAPVVHSLDELRQSVMEIISSFSKKVEQLKKQAEEEEEQLNKEIERKREEWRREEERYNYELNLKRRIEENEYKLKAAERERQFNEKLAAKEKELTQREEYISSVEDELKELRNKVANFPKEIEKAVREAVEENSKHMEQEIRIKSELSQKDAQREAQLAKFKINSLEETIKRQQSQISLLENKLNQAYSQIQQLAVTALESGNITLRDKKNIEQSDTTAQRQINR